MASPVPILSSIKTRIKTNGQFCGGVGSIGGQRPSSIKTRIKTTRS